jgi:2-polyprenyl-6-methoxyphenol hydroxylase-like FAD-dependent oxidoreductase
MLTESIREGYDVIIAGARCAGATTGMLLARAGLDVLIVDPLPRGRDTLSTHALMRGGVLQLHRWGLLDRVREAGTPPVRLTTFYYGDKSIPISITPRDGVDALYAPRRTVLDPILVDAAVAAGAHVVHGVSVQDVLRAPDGRIRGVIVAGGSLEPTPVASEMLVGADGGHSRVARLVDAPTEHTGPHRAATSFGYWPDVEVDGYHWYFGRDVAAGAIPTNEHTLVFAAVRPEVFLERRREGLMDLYLSTLRTMAPTLADELSAMPPVRLRSFAGEPGHIRRSVGPGWALVGDAGYFRDPLTAHGITDAFRDAELLARAIAVGTEDAMVGYEETRNTVAKGMMEVTDRIASFDWDYEEVQELHVTLSRQMNVGVDIIRDRFLPQPGQPELAAR